MKRALALAVLATGVAALAATAQGSSTSSRGPTSASLKSAATAKVRCGKRRKIGVAFPATGPAASIGQQQGRWAKFAAKIWNRTHKKKIRLVLGDTQLPKTSEALAVAHAFASNKKILAVTGPAGSQEVQDTITVYKKGGLGAVTGSATRVALTRSKPGKPRETPRGFFFRTVPNDGQQGDRVAFWIVKKLRKSRIYIIDDQEAYSVGLANQVQTRLRAAGKRVTRDSVSQDVSDFSALVARIPKNIQVVYLPWQLAGKAQTFYQQLRAAGKKAIVFGSDGLFAPSVFKPDNGYVSAFPVDFGSGLLRAYKRAHGGKEEAFGLPTYTSVWMNAKAISRACKKGHGRTTRKAVRKSLSKVKLSTKQSLLGFPVKFLTTTKGAYQGPGDMASPANYAIFRITNGRYTRIA
jgi:branched-chain amino acid transport system substrate-binding protein